MNKTDVKHIKELIDYTIPRLAWLGMVLKSYRTEQPLCLSETHDENKEHLKVDALVDVHNVHEAYYEDNFDLCEDDA